MSRREDETRREWRRRLCERAGALGSFDAARNEARLADDAAALLSPVQHVLGEWAVMIGHPTSGAGIVDPDDPRIPAWLINATVSLPSVGSICSMRDALLNKLVVIFPPT